MQGPILSLLAGPIVQLKYPEAQSNAHTKFYEKKNKKTCFKGFSQLAAVYNMAAVYNNIAHRHLFFIFFCI